MSLRFPFPASALQAREGSKRKMVREYTPILRNQFLHSVGGEEAEAQKALDAFWREFEELTAEIKADEERAFLTLAIYRFIKTAGAEITGGEQEDLAVMLRSMRPLDLYQRKCAYLLLCDYPKDLAGRILKLGSVQVYTSLDHLQSFYGGRIPRLSGRHKLSLVASRAADDPSMRSLTDLIDGRLKWDEKKRLEARCLDSLGILQDLVHLEEAAYFLRLARQAEGHTEVAPRG